ncbi:MAG: hypothetical protein AB1489_04490, partial [Acidobacteriota bacterium]
TLDVTSPKSTHTPQEIENNRVPNLPSSSPTPKIGVPVVKVNTKPLPPPRTTPLSEPISTNSDEAQVTEAKKQLAREAKKGKPVSVSGGAYLIACSECGKDLGRSALPGCTSVCDECLDALVDAVAVPYNDTEKTDPQQEVSRDTVKGRIPIRLPITNSTTYPVICERCNEEVGRSVVANATIVCPNCRTKMRRSNKKEK